MLKFINYWKQRIRLKVFTLYALIAAVCITAVACSSGGGASESEPSASIPPEMVTDYIHTVLEADRTAYTRHVVNRSEVLEGKDNEKGVLTVEATEGWQTADGIPLPAQMFRLGSEIAAEKGDGSFTYGLISTWNINDNQAPKNDFEKEAMDSVNETGEPYKGYQEIAGQQYFSALYPDVAVAEACVTCHNTHPIHLERYPDKVFEMGDVMGGVMINIPIEES
ncbi:DUF3365 domain-containing protein [Spirulina major CS-329]|jgi:hypothetical protein|uniref:Tll0287-like domain-containing protein n=1 Tax=Spirulina TaxID=1154 RepID=UPI0023300752|nr:MULTISPECIES: DUF3365 domain-containing protein [Spirulina]MDB9496359.1 DUF3365 domain-containing protein [Spirulina subsalsa CS-330]MDB9501699.1 DUF3365 domain-containing protein [Spirulina major CS-329]